MGDAEVPTGGVVPDVVAPGAPAWRSVGLPWTDAGQWPFVQAVDVVAVAAAGEDAANDVAGASNPVTTTLRPRRPLMSGRRRCMTDLLSWAWSGNPRAATFDARPISVMGT